MLNIKFCASSNPNSAPSAPPESPTAGEISSDAISLTWAPPPLENQNGVIIRYVINVTVVGTGETFLTFSSTNSLTLGSLRPFTTYVCVIAAETSAGVGPFSISISAQTDEACEYVQYTFNEVHASHHICNFDNVCTKFYHRREYQLYIIYS